MEREEDDVKQRIEEAHKERAFIEFATLECTAAMMKRADELGVTTEQRMTLFRTVAGHMINLLHDVERLQEHVRNETGTN